MLKRKTFSYCNIQPTAHYVKTSKRTLQKEGGDCIYRIPLNWMGKLERFYFTHLFHALKNLKNWRVTPLLHKSIPHVELWMKRPRDLAIPDYEWPEGFSLTFYEDGDETAWADIETSVAEFDERKDALAYFQKEFALIGRI